MFEYLTTFIFMPYLEPNKPSAWGKFMGKQSDITNFPDLEGFMKNEENKKHLNEMGRKGWELLSVQQVLRGMYHYQMQSGAGYGLGYSLTAGFMLFWRKEK